MRKKNGFSLTGVIIASGITALIFGFIADMVIFQNKEQKHLSQKIEITDFTNTLITTFAKPGNCSCQFANNATNPNLVNYGALHFDSTNVSGTESISVVNLYSGCLGGANLPILLAADNQLLNGTQDLIVDTVKLINLKPSGGGANPNDWQGQWQVVFKVGPGSLRKPTSPVQVTQKFTIDPTVPTVALISSCNGISTGTGVSNFLAKWSSITGMLMESGVYEEPVLKRIGMGTTVPNDTLEVVQGAGRGLTVTKYGQVGARGGAVQVRGSRGTQAAPAALLANDFLGWFYGEGFDGIGFTSHTAPTSIAIQATENWNATSNGSLLSFITIPNGTATGIERMRIDHNGNVGIGTASSPVAKLHVVGSGSTAVFERTGKALSFDPNSADLNTLAQIKADLGMGLGLYVNSNAGVGGTNAIYIKADGNVGIGTTTPTEKLHVEGIGTQRIIVRETSNGVKAKLVSAKPPDSPVPRGYVGTESNHPFSLGANDLDHITILPNGNVGIGTIAPTHKLQVAGSFFAGTLYANMPSNPTAQTVCWIGGGLLGDCASSERFKKNIVDLDIGLDSVLKMRPVRFQWKKNGGHEIGFIAEEMNSIEPTVINHNEKGEITGLKYQEVTPIIVNAIKEMNEVTLNQSSQIAALRKENQELKQAVCELAPNKSLCQTR